MCVIRRRGQLSKNVHITFLASAILNFIIEKYAHQKNAYVRINLDIKRGETMSDLIDRQAVIDAIARATRGG